MTSVALVPVNNKIARKVDNSSKMQQVRAGKEYAAPYVHHLKLEDIQRVVAVVKERDRLLITFLFDSCFRVSEGLATRPCDIVQSKDGWLVHVLGKGRKRSVVALSASMAAQIQSYIYRHNIAPEARIFPITRQRAHALIQSIYNKAGIVVPDSVGACHLLRHSGAVARMRLTGNPKAVQDQLRHSSAAMTLRYLKTLSHEDSLKIQSGVDLGW